MSKNKNNNAGTAKLRKEFADFKATVAAERDSTEARVVNAEARAREAETRATDAEARAREAMLRAEIAERKALGSEEAMRELTAVMDEKSAKLDSEYNGRNSVLRNWGHALGVKERDLERREKELKRASAATAQKVAKLEAALRRAETEAEAKIATLEEKLKETTATAGARISELTEAKVLAEQKVELLEAVVRETTAAAQERIEELEEKLVSVTAEADARILALNGALMTTTSEAQAHIAQLQNMVRHATETADARSAEHQAALLDSKDMANRYIIKLEEAARQAADVADARIAELEEAWGTAKEVAEGMASELEELQALKMANTLLSAELTAQRQAFEAREREMAVAASLEIDELRSALMSAGEVTTAMSTALEELREVRAANEMLSADLAFQRQQFAARESDTAAAASVEIRELHSAVRRAEEVTAAMSEELEASRAAADVNASLRLELTTQREALAATRSKLSQSAEANKKLLERLASMEEMFESLMEYMDGECPDCEEEAAAEAFLDTVFASNLHASKDGTAHLVLRLRANGAAGDVYPRDAFFRMPSPSDKQEMPSVTIGPRVAP